MGIQGRAADCGLRGSFDCHAVVGYMQFSLVPGCFPDPAAAGTEWVEYFTDCILHTTLD